MATELASQFQSLYHKSHDGNIRTFQTTQQYDELLESLANSLTTKTWAAIRNPDDLWILPRVMLLLSDVAIVYGVGDVPSFNAELHLNKKGAEHQFTVSKEFYERELKGKLLSTGFFYTQNSVLQTWLDDAKELINDGSLLYLPARGLMTAMPTQKNKNRHWDFINLENLPWRILRPYSDDGERSKTLVTEKTVDAQRILDLIGIDLPVIGSLPLSDYRRLLLDERDSVILLRSALRKAFEEISKAGADDPSGVLKQATKIKTDVIEPAIAQLNIKYKNVRLKRATIGAAAISAAAVSAAAIFSPTAQALVAVTGGAGGYLLTKEIMERMQQGAALKDNPWHFVWRLRQLAPK